MIVGFEIRTGTLWTERKICQDESYFPKTNSMIRKPSDIRYKVKADASFFSQGKKKRQCKTPKKTKTEDKV